MKKKIFSTLLGITLSLFGTATAQTLKRNPSFAATHCQEKFQTGHFEQGIQVCQNAAELGHAQAQNYLGLMHFKGLGVVPNNHQALHWFKQAAQQNLAEAQYHLGRMYTLGLGTNEDPKQAAIWYAKAAAQEHGPAQFLLSLSYLLGLGVPKDETQALHWYQQATQAKFAGTQVISAAEFKAPITQTTQVGETDFQQGIAALLGLTQPQNDSQALHWLTKSANLGHIEAQFQLALIYKLGLGVAVDDSMAMIWFRKAAENAHRDAQAYLAWMHAQGLGTPQDLPLANQWFQKILVEHNHNYEQLNGKTNGNDSTALVAQATQGDPHAQYQLALQLLQNSKDATNIQQGLHWLNKAAAQAYAQAQYQLGEFLLQGQYLESDVQLGVQWLTKAATQAYAPAQYKLGLYYYQGPAQNLIKAYAWLNLAAAQGLHSAHILRQSISRTMQRSEIQQAQALSKELKQQTLVP
jgi:TPR repeat protein